MVSVVPLRAVCVLASGGVSRAEMTHLEAAWEGREGWGERDERDGVRGDREGWAWSQVDLGRG